MKKLKKNHPNFVAQKQPLLRKFVIIYSLFFFFSSCSSPQNLCFKNSEGVQERAWSREYYGILEDPVFHRGTQKEEGEVLLVHIHKLLVSWPINEFVWATVSDKYLYMFLSDRMLSLLISFHEKLKVKWRLSLYIETLC